MSYQSHKESWEETVKIVSIYALFGIGWIYGSDTVLGWLVHDQSVILKIAVAKGSFFILCTAALLYFLINRFVRRVVAAGDRLSDSLKYYEAIFNATSKAIFVLDAQSGCIVDVNNRMLEIYGYERDEALSANIGQLSEGTAPFSQEDAVEKVRKANSEASQCFEWLARKRNGELFWAEVSISKVKLNDFERIIAVVRDISEHKKAVESLSRLNRTLRTLTKCNEILVRAENEFDLLHEVCRVIVDDGGYRFAWVAYAEHDMEKSVHPVAHAGHEAGYLEKLVISWTETEAGMGPTGTAIRTGQAACFRDIEQEPAYAIWRDEARKRGYRSTLAIPLVSSEQPGALNIYAAEADAFDAAEIELMVHLANDLAYGIKSLRTRVKHRQASEALYESAEEYRNLAVARAQEKNLLRALIDSIPDLIFFKDQASVYLGCNKAFEAFAGRTEEELIGLTDLDMFPREIGEFFREMDHQMMSERKARTNEEWVDYPDGRLVFLETLKSPYHDTDGAVLGLIGISRDITSRK